MYDKNRFLPNVRCVIFNPANPLFNMLYFYIFASNLKNMNRIKTVLFHIISLSFVFTTGCKEHTEQKKYVEANIYTRYMDQESILKTVIGFKYGKDSTALVQDTNSYHVKFLNQVLQKKDLHGTVQYLYENRMDAAPSPLSYLLKGPDFTEQHFEEPIHPLAVTDSIINYTPGNILSLSINGKPLENREEVTVIVVDAASNTATGTIKGPVMEKTLLFNLDNPNLSKGTGKVYLVRKTYKEITKDRTKIIYLLEFYSREYDIHIG